MINFSEFHFLRPEWLWAILPLILLVLVLRFIHRQKSGWQGVLASHLYQHLVNQKDSLTSRPPMFLLALGWLLVTLALAGPTWERLPQPVYQLHTGKVVVMDMSLSMRATDIKPNRLTRARYKAIDLVDAIAEGETGLVAYAGDAFVISPLSTDAQNLTALIPSLSPEIMPVPGSEPILGLEAAASLLESAGYQQGEIYWITDGTEDRQINEITRFLQSTPYRLSVLAVGTEDGAPIALRNGELLKDASGAIVVPRLNSDNLEQLSDIGQGRYAPMQADDSDVSYLTSQDLIERETSGDQEDENKVGDEWKEMGPYLVLLLLPIAAYSFRRGLIAVFLATVLLPSFSPQAHANWWNDMWKTGDQQGQQAFKKQEFASAAEQFNDPMWKGAARYKEGDYQAALDAFSQLDTTDALYNQGNALAQLGQTEEALAAYEKVLIQDPDHADARANKELLEQQQQNQNQQNQKGDNQDQQSDPNQEQNQQNEDGEDGTGEGTQQQQPNSQPSEDQQQDQQSEGQPEDEGKEGEEGEEQQEQQGQEEQQAEEQNAQEGQASEAEAELTQEEKEQMQRMQNLLRKVPDDPSFLLKRKMQLENQKRRRQPVPGQAQRNW